MTEMSTIMSTESLSLGPTPGRGSVPRWSVPRFIGRWVRLIATARQGQAEARVASTLGSLSERQLADIGLAAGRAARVRAAGYASPGQWIY